MEIALKLLENAIVVEMPHHFAILFENVPEEAIRWEKILCCGKHSSYCRRGTY